MRPSVCLVLGAGASLPYGFPLGSALTTEIIRLPSAGRAIHHGVAIDEDELKEFTDALTHSGQMSIDAFLAHRPDHVAIGKRAIAYILLNHEKPNRLFMQNIDGDWYRYLITELTRLSWEELDLTWLRVVTFNYDRSFEARLFEALRNTYQGRSESDVRAKLAQISLVHVYGSLSGNETTWERPAVPFGAPPNAMNVSRAAESLQVIPEGRNDAPSITRARLLLSSSDRIAFLGFGFDATNLERLNAAQTCASVVSGTNRRRVVGTVFGMRPAEVAKAMRLTAQKLIGTPENSGFHNTDCLGLLRETLILD